MTSKEFVLWLKGFTEGVHEFNITPKQWDLLKDKLAEVKDETPIGFPFGVPNTAPMTNPLIPPQPYNPLKKKYCSSIRNHLTSSQDNHDSQSLLSQKQKGRAVAHRISHDRGNQDSRS
jgi:hypothetical protein